MTDAITSKTSRYAEKVLPLRVQGEIISKANKLRRIEMEHDYPFWVVWNPVRVVPFVRHETIELAKKEAERLAHIEPGEHFYVMEAKFRLMEIKPIQCVELGFPF